MHYRDISIAFSNSWDAIVPMAHLRHALELAEKTKIDWLDMDAAVDYQDIKNIFVGEPPSSFEDCLKRINIAMGSSAANMASSTRKSKWLIVSKRGRRSLKVLGPSLQSFIARFVEGDGRRGVRYEDVMKIINKCPWQYRVNDDGHILFSHVGDSDPTQNNNVRELSKDHTLLLFAEMMYRDIEELSFDYLQHHRTCWSLLNDIKNKVQEDLIQMYGDDPRALDEA
ncbi:hypothetical protein BS50DRAFT_643215 [Corynespora cassiicola Philippines]|uniref:Uncharacterized protein n=1 Tax=Corynespora cassiicola Philippines TaxID=1448308 RepID=A0A2T2PBK1_CORCC|nr:hypothetical protein BS50DRAFT_643215 [Corynespora cassiicola Philippines]